MGAVGGLLQAGFGIAQAIRNNKLRKKYENQLEAEVNAMPEYSQDPAMQGLYAQAQAQQNAINPAIAQMYQQAQMNAANTAAAGQRVAGSGAEAINAAIAGQALANNIMPQLAQLQTQYAQNNYGNLVDASQLLNKERMNVFNSRLAKNDARQNLKTMQFGNAQKSWQDSWGNMIGGANAVEDFIGKYKK